MLGTHARRLHARVCLCMLVCSLTSLILFTICWRLLYMPNFTTLQAAAMPNNFYAHARRQERQDARVHSGSTRLHFMAMRDAPEICETAGCVYSLFLADMTFEFSLSMVVVRV